MAPAETHKPSIKGNNWLATLLSMAERGDGPPDNNMSEPLGILSTELKGPSDRLTEVWNREPYPIRLTETASISP
jgi:hypothetical protein